MNWLQKIAQTDLSWILSGPSEDSRVGQETGSPVSDGISIYQDPYGSYRYVYYENSQPIAGIQIVSDGERANVANVYTRPEHVRRKLATMLFRRAQSDFPNLQHSPHTTDKGDDWITSLSSLQKISAPIRTQDFPQILAKAIQYELGGEWGTTQPTPWTENLERITGDPRLGQEVGYSTSFWVFCKAGDGHFNEKWGVSVNFTVTSGSSNTMFESETGDWDFSIDASVQWASPASWTPASPYALMIKAVGHEENMRTVQEVANFVKTAIWNNQTGDDDDDWTEPETDPTPEPGVNLPASPELVGV